MLYVCLLASMLISSEEGAKDEKNYILFSFIVLRLASIYLIVELPIHLHLSRLALLQSVRSKRSTIDKDIIDDIFDESIWGELASLKEECRSLGPLCWNYAELLGIRSNQSSFGFHEILPWIPSCT